MDTTSFIRSLPKAELHLHIEGTLEPEMMVDLAARNGIALPFATVEEVRAAYEFSDLQSFLDIYYQGAAVLVTEQDFYDLMLAYLERAVSDGVRRAEIFFDPQTHTERGIGFGVFMDGFTRAMIDAKEYWGISAGLIMCFLRHLPGDAALGTWHEAEPYLDDIIGVGLDSAEVGNPPVWFFEAYSWARAAGLHAVAHAGEEGPPSYVTGALDTLHAERIDHGVRCEEDPALVDRLVREQIPLTMCPLSNVKLRVFDRLEDHNLKRLLDRGLRVTINSDDPAYFGGYVLDNYVATAEALNLNREDLVALARNSIEASFLPDGEKLSLLEELAAFATT
ncbi:MAG: adenosine deaminase [Actinomycetota bacterium]|nr:adenosine deaminase [Actinomycetota bacterium]